MVTSLHDEGVITQMRIKARILAAAGAGGLVLVMGQAATASNTVSTSVTGYGTASISGATANSVGYTLSSDGATITGVSIVFAGDLTGKTVTAGFNSTALSACSLAAYNANERTTTVSCTGLAQSTAAATSLAVAVRQ